MATIRKRGTKWQVQVRKQSHAPISKSFHNKKDAVTWANQIECSIDLGKPHVGQRLNEKLSDILIRYRDEITPLKKGHAPEHRRLNRLLKDKISRTSLSELDGPTLAQFRDRRIKDGVRACQYDLVLIRHALEIGRKEWGVSLVNNPVNEIRVPNGIKKRERRLTSYEQKALQQAAKQCRNPYIWPIVEFALETAMRRSEILRLRWQDVDFQKRLAHLEDSKNGSARAVPLSLHALNILSGLPTKFDKVFFTTEYAIRQAWERLVERAGVEDLRFHDLRHEAVSRFFEDGLSVPEVALISGHKDVRMLFRYTHLKPEHIVAKLNELEQG